MKERYDNLDGLRAISCLCIIAMHIRANASFNLPGAADRVVASWTHFVPLFLMISGFGMFCGYYERFRNGTADLNSFYKKRYLRLLPFFLTLIVIDVLMNRSFSHVIEGAAEMTLVFGLLPNNQPEVIGVCWTLGVIFLFYMLFPFVVYLCWTRRRAWLAFAASVILAVICSEYYFTDRYVTEGFAARHNILYCAPWILGGGLVYLNREAVKRFVSRFRWIWLAFCTALSVGWYFVPNGTTGVLFKSLAVFIPWLMYAVSVNSRILSSRVMKYLGGISFEMYLAQMVVFRVVEKTKILYLGGHGWIGFAAAWLMTSAGLVVFIEAWRRIRALILKRTEKR